MESDVRESCHARHLNMHDRYRVGDTYDPERFQDPEGYREKIESYEQPYPEQLARQRSAR